MVTKVKSRSYFFLSSVFGGILQNLDSGLWTGPWTGLWTGLVATITSYVATASNSPVTTLTAFVLVTGLKMMCKSNSMFSAVCTDHD